MKFNFLKARKKQPAKRGRSPSVSSSRKSPSRSRQKNTPMHSEMPELVKKLLKAGLVAIVAALVIAGHYIAFRMYYYKSKNLFVIQDVDKNVAIDTGRAVTPDLVKMFLGITNGVHLFSINVNDKRDQLLKDRPGIKDIAIQRIVPDQLVVTVIERKPVARVGSEGEVVDDEGVVFARSSRNTGHLPIICKAKLKHNVETPMPGDKLQDMDLAAVKLAASTYRPECKARPDSIDTSRQRYLYLTFPDGREAKFAWKDMLEFTSDSRDKMILQYDRLISCMETDVGKLHHEWDAQHSDRIYGRPAGIINGGDQ